jgi:hypothetical protein
MRLTRKNCEAVAGKLGLGVEFYEDGPRPADCLQDDGTLHVSNAAGFRACFDVSHGQSSDGKEQNECTRAVLTALGMEKKITDRVLVEEEEKDAYCPHCCREY